MRNIVGIIIKNFQYRKIVRHDITVNIMIIIRFIVQEHAYQWNAAILSSQFYF